MGDYTSLNRPYQVLIMGIKAANPPPPTPLRVLMISTQPVPRGPVGLARGEAQMNRILLRVPSFRESIGVSYTVLGVPYDNYSIVGPKTLF